MNFDPEQEMPNTLPSSSEDEHLSSATSSSGAAAASEIAPTPSQTDSSSQSEPSSGEPAAVRPFEDYTLAEALAAFLRAPVSTFKAVAAIARETPEAPAPLSSAMAKAPVPARMLPTVPPAPLRDEILDVPQLAWREVVQLVLRVIAFVLAWWGSFVMVNAPVRSEAVGLAGGLPWLLLGFMVWVAAEFVPILGARETSRSPSQAARVAGDQPAAQAHFHYPALLARAGLFAATCVLAGVAVLQTADNRFTLLGALTWFASIFLAAWTVAPARWSPGGALRALSEHLRYWQPRLNWVALALLAIVVLGAYFRLKDINLVPPEMTSDHVEMLLDVHRLFNGQTSVFFASNGGREAMQFYLLAVFSQIPGIGLNFLSLKLLNALESILTIVVVFFMGRAVIGPREHRLGTLVGLLLAAFVAVSYWHVVITRFSERIVLMPLATAFLMIFLARALRSNQRSDFIWAGLAVGFGLYTYQAFRAVPLVLVAAAGLMAMANLRDGSALRALVGNFAALAFVALIVYLPLFSYSLQFPEDYWRRTSGRLFSDEISQIEDEAGNLIFRQPTLAERLDALQEYVPALLVNFRNALLMYNWKGDVAWVQSAPSHPALDPIAGGLLIVGAAAWLFRIARRRGPVEWLVPLAFVIFLLPSVLAIARPIENPSATRISGTLPFVYLIAAYALALMLRSTARLVGGRPGAFVAVLAAVGLIAGSYAANHTTYFVTYREQYVLNAQPYRDAGRALRSVAQNIGGFGNAFIINRPFWWDHRAVGIEAGSFDFPNGVPDRAQLGAYLAAAAQRQGSPYQLNVHRDIVLFYASDDTITHEWLVTVFPNGSWQEMETSRPGTTFRLFRIPAPGDAGFQRILDLLERIEPMS
ncbi:MAG: hypothetical protein SNJ59_05755 [Aggregatilineales bacterium]